MFFEERQHRRIKNFRLFQWNQMTGLKNNFTFCVGYPYLYNS